MKGKLKHWRWVGPIGLMTAVTLLSGGTVPTFPRQPIIGFDKVAHFFVFGLIATSILRTFPSKVSSFVSLIIAVVLTSLFGMSDEFHQSFTPGRTLDIYDWIADTLGALVAVIAYQNWSLYRKVLEWPVIPVRTKKNPTQPERLS